MHSWHSFHLLHSFYLFSFIILDLQLRLSSVGQAERSSVVPGLLSALHAIFYQPGEKFQRSLIGTVSREFQESFRGARSFMESSLNFRSIQEIYREISESFKGLLSGVLRNPLKHTWRALYQSGTHLSVVKSPRIFPRFC